jgi:hypothetical protein
MMANFILQTQQTGHIHFHFLHFAMSVAFLLFMAMLVDVAMQ